MGTPTRIVQIHIIESAIVVKIDNMIKLVHSVKNVIGKNRLTFIGRGRSGFDLRSHNKPPTVNATKMYVVRTNIFNRTNASSNIKQANVRQPIRMRAVIGVK
jgi:hypothetical protein